MEQKITLAHFPEMDEVDKALFDKNIETFFSRISFLPISQLELNFKDYSKGGLRKQHEIHAKLISPKDVFFASETGWKLMETIQVILKKLEKEVLKKHSHK